MTDSIAKSRSTIERTREVRALFQRLELIVEQYHALWRVQPEIHYSSGLVIATLRALVANDSDGGAGLSQSEIALAIRRSPVLVTRLMKEMEAAGLVERGQGKFDHRQRTVRITPEGRGHLAAFEDVKAEIGDRIFAYGTPDVWAQVTGGLDHISSVLDAFGEPAQPGSAPPPDKDAA